MTHGELRRHTLWVACVCADNWFSRSAVYVLTLYLFSMQSRHSPTAYPFHVFLCVRGCKGNVLNYEDEVRFERNFA